MFYEDKNVVYRISSALNYLTVGSAALFFAFKIASAGPEIDAPEIQEEPQLAFNVPDLQTPPRSVSDYVYDREYGCNRLAAAWGEVFDLEPDVENEVVISVDGKKTQVPVCKY